MRANKKRGRANMGGGNLYRVAAEEGPLSGSGGKAAEFSRPIPIGDSRRSDASAACAREGMPDERIAEVMPWGVLFFFSFFSLTLHSGRRGAQTDRQQTHDLQYGQRDN